MKQTKNYYLLFLASFLLLLFGFIVKDEMIDINVYDTYYVILRNHFFWLISIILFLFFMIYLLFDKAKINYGHLFSKVHIFGTLISVLGLLFPYSLIFRTNEFPLNDNLQYINLFITISFLVFLMLQILFIINIFVILTKRFFKRILYK